MTLYAIGYAPAAESALAKFGAHMLGYDLVSGAEVEPLDDPVFHDPASLGWTAAPRRYGFQGLLKAPMQLAPGRSARELETALVAFVQDQRPFPITMTLSLMEHFLALVLAEPSPGMDALAAACVTHFDPFRTPLSPEDRERQHPERLTATQVEMLDLYGEPFVLEQFQFHMTLTGALEPKDRGRLEPVLRAIVASVPLTTTVDSLVLCRQEGANDRFVLQRRFDFGG